MTWYTRVILPCSCPITVGFADFLPPLPCLVPCTGGSLGSRTSLLCVHVSAAFWSTFCVAFCRFAPLYCTGPSLKVSRKPHCTFPLLWGAKCLFLGQVLCSDQSSAEHRIKLVYHFPSSEQGFEGSLCSHGAHYEFLNAYRPSSATAAMEIKTFFWGREWQSHRLF